MKNKFKLKSDKKMADGSVIYEGQILLLIEDEKKFDKNYFQTYGDGYVKKFFWAKMEEVEPCKD